MNTVKCDNNKYNLLYFMTSSLSVFLSQLHADKINCINNYSAKLGI